MRLKINLHSEVICDESMSVYLTAPLLHALAVLQRDMRFVLKETEQEGLAIRLCRDDLPEEMYVLAAEPEALLLRAGSTMGFVYGIFGISRHLLGILPFWFWNGQSFRQRKEITVSDRYYLASKPFAVRYRGWFINDEVLIAKWRIHGDGMKPWEMVFEALLRCGGNMVIPGTDIKTKENQMLAARMGLAISHHHAEPLGAEMFSRAWPDLKASYSLYPEKFHELWKQALEDQKDMEVVWNLGFRGQGDCPFWADDPAYDTPRSRGRLISELLNRQYRMVKERFPDAACCTNLYGEVMELYREGFLAIPDDVIKVWADNGYGKMVSRRQENHNPRVPALPAMEDPGRNGIYYHVSFYDLQAANHITMLPAAPGFITGELQKVLDHGGRDFWMINCSNVKPHVFYLDLIAGLWAGENVKVPDDYIGRYFAGESGEARAELSRCFTQYREAAVSYGKHEDDLAGEQFCNHGTRVLAVQWMRDRETAAEEFLWAHNGRTLAGQISWFYDKAIAGKRAYTSLSDTCERVRTMLSAEGKILLADTLLLHSEIYRYCYTGMVYFSEGFTASRQGDAKRAFYLAGMAAESFRQADQAMQNREHGIWVDFYDNECLTDIKQTVWVLEGLMSWIRALDDGPHYYQWQRQFLYPEKDRKVMLLLNLENHLTDREIFPLMRQVYENTD